MKPDPEGKHWEDCRWVLDRTRTLTPEAHEVVNRIRPTLRCREWKVMGPCSCSYLNSNEFCLTCYSTVVEQLFDSCEACCGQPLYHRCGSCVQQILTRAHGFCAVCAETMAIVLAGTAATYRAHLYETNRAGPVSTPQVPGRPELLCRNCHIVQNGLYANVATHNRTEVPMLLVQHHPVPTPPKTPDPDELTIAVVVHEDGHKRGDCVTFRDYARNRTVRVVAYPHIHYVEYLDGKDALGQSRWTRVAVEDEPGLIARATLFLVTRSIRETKAAEIASTPMIDLLTGLPVSEGGLTGIAGLAAMYGAAILGSKE